MVRAIRVRPTLNWLASCSDAELVGELLADSPDAAVAQVVDVINGGFVVDQLDEILDDLDDILFGQNPDIGRGGQAQLPVETVAAHLSEVVALVGEEELVDNVAGCGLVRRF